MTRVLVLGGSSYVAQFILQRHLAAERGSKHDIMACTLRGQQASTPALPAEFVSVSTATASSSSAAVTTSSRVHVYWGVDLGTMTGVRECIRHFHPEVVINCVELTVVGVLLYGVACLVFQPRELIEFISKEIEWQVRLVHFSTDFVYDGVNPPPYGYKESDAVKSLPASSSSSPSESTSLTVYGASKLSFDAFLLAAEQQQYAHLSGFILRIANVIGPQSPLFADQPPKFMEWLHQQLFCGRNTTSRFSGKPQLRLWSDEIRSFIYVRDLAAIVFALLERDDEYGSSAGSTPSSPRFLLLNIGGVDALSRVELAEKYCDACQRINPQETGPHATIAPTSRASVDLGYHPPLNAHLDTSLLRHQLPSLALTPTDRIMNDISQELLTK